MKQPHAEQTISCPSSQPDTDDSVIFGVVVGARDARQIGYLSETRPVTPATLALAGNVRPTEVFRIAGPCAKASCKHFVSNECVLAQRIVQQLEPVVSGLPPCGIRKTCRWFHQEGKAACMRCPQVITDRRDASVLERRVANGGESVDAQGAAAG
jgi:hypothetical protein